MNTKIIIAALLIAVLCFASFGMATVNKNDPKRNIRGSMPTPKKVVKAPVKRVIATKKVPKKVVKTSVPKKVVKPNLNKH